TSRKSTACGRPLSLNSSLSRWPVAARTWMRASPPDTHCGALDSTLSLTVIAWPAGLAAAPAPSGNSTAAKAAADHERRLVIDLSPVRASGGPMGLPPAPDVADPDSVDINPRAPAPPPGLRSAHFGRCACSRAWPRHLKP